MSPRGDNDQLRARVEADKTEAARLIKRVAGKPERKETTKSRIRRTAQVLGWSVERVRHIWHGDAARIDAFEMDQLRLLDAIGERFSSDESEGA